MYKGELNHERSARHRQGIKVNKFHTKVRHTPSTVDPESTLNIKIPQISASRVIYPDSLNMTCDVKFASDATVDDIPDHLTSAIIKKFVMVINGQTVFDINNYNHLAIYREFWHSKHQYGKELTHRGIQSSATKKKRHSLTNAAEDTLASIHGKRYAFSLGSFLTDAAFTPQAIHGNIEFHLTFASGKYEISDICLEYDYIDDPILAAAIIQKYENHVHVVNDYSATTTYVVQKEKSDLHMNIPASCESLRAVLVFFKEDHDASTTYDYPSLENVEIDIDGSNSQLFTTQYLPSYAYRDAKNYFSQPGVAEAFIDQEKFYHDKFCLVIDLRTINDEKSSDTGRQIKDHIRLKISKNATDDDGKAYVFLVTDKSISFVNNQISAIRK